MSSTVNADSRLPVPDPFKEVVFRDYPESPAAFWGREKSQGFAVLCSDVLSKPDFEILKSDDGTFQTYKLNEDNWVHIADAVVDETEISDEPGEVVYFFMYGEMMEGDTKSAYVLTEKQAWRFLPVEEIQGEGVTETLLSDVPGFLSSP
ncbi:hypothetical protein [Halobacterium sp. NMX12-1]